MVASLHARVGLMIGIVVLLALATAGLAVVAASGMERATGKLLLSQAQLDSALRLRAAPHVAGADVPGLLALYSDQIEAEDRLAADAGEHRAQQTERLYLARLRLILRQGRGEALDRLTKTIVRREQGEADRSRQALAATERAIARGAAAIGLMLLAAAALFVAMLRGSILRPIRALIGAVAALRTGQFGVVPRGRLPREFDQLAAGFNDMAAHIRRQHEQLAAVNRMLEERLAARTRALAEVLGLELDQDMRVLRCRGHATALTERECGLLAFLLERKGRTVSRAQILQSAWAGSAEATDNLVDVYVGYLRRKLRAIEAPWEIRTVRGAGFTLCERQDVPA